eukprot:8410593-Pyramimonas_sp.AAC.1
MPKNARSHFARAEALASGEARVVFPGQTPQVNSAHARRPIEALISGRGSGPNISCSRKATEEGRKPARKIP